MTERHGAWIQTYTGRRFFPLAPRAEDVVIEDIAHSLSLLNRFAGHTRAPYSVAQHSILVARNCPPAFRLWALLHDATEAYCVDVPLPIKRVPEMAGYRMIEARVQAAICERFGLMPIMPARVKAADRILLMTEARDLLPHPPVWADLSLALPERIEPWSAAEAEARFLAKFAELHAAVEVAG